MPGRPRPRNPGPANWYRPHLTPAPAPGFLVSHPAKFVFFSSRGVANVRAVGAE